MKFDLFAAKAEEKLKDFPDNHFDSCVHDGPYGIHFMGKAWDKFHIERMIKDQGKSRTEEGWNHDSMAAGKYDRSHSANQLFQQWTTEIALEVYRVLKPGAYFLSFCSPRTFHRLVCGIEDAGFEIRDTLMWVFGSGFPKSHNLKDEWEGWGSALKPAYEPIVMARKPLEKGLTIAENMKKWGTGAINIKDSLIDGEPWRYGTQTDLKGGNYGTNRPSDGHVHAKDVIGGEEGRWPANLMHDGSEEVVAMFPENETASGIASGPTRGKLGTQGRYGGATGENMGESKFYGDVGSAARFFYVPKTSRADRNEGCNHLVKKPLIWSSGTKNPGSFQSDNTDRSSSNNHPTVKPTGLMQYLVRMVTRKNGLCLDHMCGSGSTIKACAIEGIDAVGIDEDPHNIEIARLRTQYIIDHYDLFGTYIKPK